MSRGPSTPWNIFIAVAATLGAIIIPAHVVGSRDLVPRFLWYDILLNIIFLADLVVRLQHRGRRSGIPGWVLYGADILAVLPLHLLTGIGGLALFRLLKLTRVAELLVEWRHHNLQRWNVLRLVYFIYWMGLCVHWLACGWLELRGVAPGTDVWTGYVRSLYWCVSTLTTIGYADNMPSTNPEIIYSIMVMIFGVATYGYVIGNAANILVNIDPARAGYFTHMEKLSSFMTYRGIPPELQRRVRDYHRYVWDNRLGYDEESIMTGLPPALMTEVMMFLKRDVIQNVPFFATASEQLLKDVALVMHPAVYMPGDLVFKKGDVGRAMYFISKGEIEVLDGNGARIALLGKGDAFGEMALVLDKPRGATIRTAGYCDLYRLDKKDFDDILRRYPEFAVHVRQLTRLRSRWKLPGKS